MAGSSEDKPTSYRLFTTVTDPQEASAADLAGAYARRWKIGLVFGELSAHQRGARTVTTPSES